MLSIKISNLARRTTLLCAMAALLMPRAQAAADAVPADMLGLWCWVQSFQANAGGGSSSRTCFFLAGDGTYAYEADRDMSAYSPGMVGMTNSRDSDVGRWSVNGTVLTAQGQRYGYQQFRLTKVNHPKTGDPMLCLNEDCFVTQQARRPWPPSR